MYYVFDYLNPTTHTLVTRYKTHIMSNENGKSKHRKFRTIKQVDKFLHNLGMVRISKEELFIELI
jgi:hypothetical protein